MDAPKSTKPTATPPPQTFLNKAFWFLTLYVGNISFMLISALIIHNYDPTASTPKPIPEYTVLNQTFSLPVILAQPPPLAFLFAGMLYMFALSSFPIPPNEDRYQILFLGSGGMAAHLLSMNKGLSDLKGFVMAMKSYLPLTVTIALVVSLIVHALLRYSQEEAWIKAGTVSATEKKKES